VQVLPTDKLQLLSASGKFQELKKKNLPKIGQTPSFVIKLHEK
jgi:hypothetical protein